MSKRFMPMPIVVYDSGVMVAKFPRDFLLNLRISFRLGSVWSKLYAHGNLFDSFPSTMSSHNLLNFTTIYHTICSPLTPGFSLLVGIPGTLPHYSIDLQDLLVAWPLKFVPLLIWYCYSSGAIVLAVLDHFTTV